MAIVKPIIAPKSNDPKEIARWYDQIATRQSYQTYAGDPTGNILPRWIGDKCLDTSQNDWYVSYGVTALTWKAMVANSLADLGVTATAAEVNSAIDGILATYSELNTAADGISNPPIAGDSTAGRVVRNGFLTIANGTNANTLKMQLFSLWNADTIALTDNISGGTVGDFYYNTSVATDECRVLASGLTGNCVGLINSQIVQNYCATHLVVDASPLAGDILLKFRQAPDGTSVTLDTLVDTGYFAVNFSYITSA